jgi:HK97 family phage major capsid protein
MEPITPDVLGELIESKITAAFNPEALAAALVEGLRPAVRKDLIDTHGDAETERKIKGANWFMGIYGHDIKGKALTDDIVTATIDDDHVGYAVPTEISTEINRIESQISLAMLLCRTFPQKAETVNKLLLSSGLTMTHPTEAASGGYTKPTYTQVVFTKKKGMMNIPVSNDVFTVSAPDMFDELVRLLAEESSKDIDTYAFNDNTSPHVGILNGAGNSVYLGSATSGVNLSNVGDDDLYDFLIDMTTEVDPSVLGSGIYMFSSTVLGRIRKLKDTTGAPINCFERRQPGDAPHIAGYIDGYPVVVSTRMPSYTTCSAADIAIGWFGDPQKYEIGQNSDIVIDMSREGTLAVGDGTLSAWQSDLTLVRGRVFRSAAPAVPAAFTKLENATS